MLKYSLLENVLTERTDDYSAQVHSMASLGKEALIARMLQRGTLLTRTDILAVLNSLEETVADMILEGNNVTLPLFNISFSISGVFDGATDTFDPNRHKFNINLTKGALLREVEKKVKLEKTSSTPQHPAIQEVKDSMSATVNEQLTPGGVVELRGYNLKIEGDDPACGLWFVPEKGAEVKAATLIENKPSRLLAMIPALGAGNWQAKVITQYTGGNLLKTPKVFVFPKNLTVK